MSTKKKNAPKETKAKKTEAEVAPAAETETEETEEVEGEGEEADGGEDIAGTGGDAEAAPEAGTEGEPAAEAPKKKKKDKKTAAELEETRKAKRKTESDFRKKVIEMILKSPNSALKAVDIATATSMKYDGNLRRLIREAQDEAAKQGHATDRPKSKDLGLTEEENQMYYRIKKK